MSSVKVRALREPILFFLWMNTGESKDPSGHPEMSDKTGNECLGERAKKKLKRFFRKRL